MLTESEASELSGELIVIICLPSIYAINILGKWLIKLLFRDEKATRKSFLSFQTRFFNCTRQGLGTF